MYLLVSKSYFFFIVSAVLYHEQLEKEKNTALNQNISFLFNKEIKNKTNQ